MQALIFNSGTGSRMGTLTHNKPKCLIEIAGGVTILDNQIRCLIQSGISSFVITTGKYDALIKEHIASKSYEGAFTFVYNPLYEKTNYIYSMYLARGYLASDIITLHGDMVFDEYVIRGLIGSPHESAVILNSGLRLSEKDFNASLTEGIVTKINVGDRSANHLLLPVYKLGGADLSAWIKEVERFVGEGKTGVYAENAFNEVSHNMGLMPYFIDVEKSLCMEIDTFEDLEICRGILINREEGNE